MIEQAANVSRSNKKKEDAGLFENEAVPNDESVKISLIIIVIGF
jgi:hypothetical protein